jgi:hypothetical protein
VHEHGIFDDGSVDGSHVVCSSFEGLVEFVDDD